jgi:hypothetical protein
MERETGKKNYGELQQKVGESMRGKIRVMIIINKQINK